MRYSERSKTWTATLPHAGRTYSVAGMVSEEEARAAYDRMVLHYCGPDFPRLLPRRKLEAASQATLRREMKAKRRARSGTRHPGSQGFYGVYFSAKASERPWLALLSTPGPTVRWREGSKLRQSHRRCHYLGSYETEREAAEAHDRAVLHYYGPECPYLNYPDRAHSLEPADAATLTAYAYRLGKQTKTSQFRGVSYSQSAKAWMARISHEGKQRQLGTFASEIQAAFAYNQAALELRGQSAKPNFHPTTGEPLLGLSLQQFDARQKTGVPSQPKPRSASRSPLRAPHRGRAATR